MAIVTETAPAKINLTLEILGRRPDGYHELESLVAFASVGDRLSLDTSASTAVAVTGPFAGSIVGPNILDRTLTLLSERAPALRLGAVHLEKELPVAAGIGGGSANAAALLRAVRKANPDHAAAIDWHALAISLGADVAVCLESHAAWMSGIGEEVAPLSKDLPRLDAVLVNPMAPVPADKTARVFKALAAGPLAGEKRQHAPSCSDRETLLAFMRECGNDLGQAAQSVVPEAARALERVKGLPGVAYAAISGAGPTCFGIFGSGAEAEAARRSILADAPGWWCVAATIG